MGLGPKTRMTASQDLNLTTSVKILCLNEVTSTSTGAQGLDTPFWRDMSQLPAAAAGSSSRGMAWSDLGLDRLTPASVRRRREVGRHVGVGAAAGSWARGDR